jgi:hypothetical protein
MDDTSTEVLDIDGPNAINDEDPKSLSESGNQEDMVDEAIPSEVVVLEADASNDVVCIKKEAVRRKAVLWPPIEKHEGKKLVFPFLERESRDRDYYLCLIMVQERVFTSSHGSKNKIWEGVRTLLSEQKNDNGELLFPDGISSINTLRRRADALMKWIKNFRDSAAIRSGTDDEDHNEFIVLLENLLEEKESAEEQVAEKLTQTNKTNQRKSSEAEVLRLAAMSTDTGKKRLAEVLKLTGENEEEGRNKQSNPTGVTPKNKRRGGATESVSSLSRSPPEGGDFNAMNSGFNERMKLKQQELNRHAIKQKKLDLKCKDKSDWQDTMMKLMLQQQELMTTQTEKMSSMEKHLAKIAKKK